MAKRQSVEKQFFRGDHEAVLARTIDRSGRAPAGSETWVVGALCFQGRLEEAEVLFQSVVSRRSEEAAVESRFYLAVARCRRADYRGARALLGENLRRVRRLRSPRARFFAYQGLAFYRYFQGRFPLALAHGRLAFENAAQARFLFGRAFSQELIGHCQVQVGEVSAGLAALERAEACASALGDGGLRRSFRIARAAYRAQFGIAPRVAVAELERLHRETGPALLYSRGVLALELARQYLLRGRASRAQELLDEACPAIYGTSHRRQGAALSLRYAELCHARGEGARALHGVKTAFKTLDREVDHELALSLLGMERKLLETLGLRREARALHAELRERTRRAGSAVGWRVLARAGSGSETAAAPERSGRREDPLGELLDEVHRDGEARAPATELRLAREIQARGLLGLFYPLYDVPRSARVLFVDLRARVAVRFELGDVALGQPGELTPLMIEFLRALEGGREAAKEALVRRVWGYADYHPHRHDPALYRLITRLRAALGPAGAWVEASESGGYRLREGVSLRWAGADTETAVVLKATGRAGEGLRADSAMIGAQALTPSDLNYRQYLILDLLARERFVSAGMCRKRLRVSEVTARRDLSALTRLGRVRRYGRGRATRYGAIEISPQTEE